MKEQIEKLKNDITECYGQDPMYYGVVGDFLAENLVKMGWRKQSYGEWIWDREHLNYKCSLCGEYDIGVPKFCRECGAKMKGGAE